MRKKMFGRHFVCVFGKFVLPLLGLKMRVVGSKQEKSELPVITIHKLYGIN